MVHPKHDSGVRSRAADFLRTFLNQFERALAIFDLEGCGVEDQPPVEIERLVEESLAANGWQDRCSVIVLVPELESWIWDESFNVRKVVNPELPPSEVRVTLQKAGFLAENQSKPARPKEAFEHLLRGAKVKRSSSLYMDLGREINFSQCKDRSFHKFRATLKTWFPDSPRTL